MRRVKKGFTIVELVIVIAVIAILAAVLIPTFSGVIQKANLSNDVQICKNMNTQLVSDFPVGVSYPADVTVAKESLQSYNKHFSPKTSGYHYYWYQGNDTVYLANDTNSQFNIYFPEDEDNKVKTAYDTNSDNFYRIDLEYCLIKCSLEDVTFNKNVLVVGEDNIITFTGSAPSKVKIGTTEYTVKDNKITVKPLSNDTLTIGSVVAPTKFDIVPTFIHSKAYEGTADHPNTNPVSIEVGKEETLYFKAHKNCEFLGDPTKENDDLVDIKKEIGLEGADFVSWSVNEDVATLTIKNPTNKVTFNVPGKRTVNQYTWKSIYYNKEVNATNCGMNPPTYDYITFKKLTSSDTDESVKASFDALPAPVVNKDEDGKIDYVLGNIAGKSAIYFYDGDKTYASDMDSLFYSGAVITSCIDFDNFSTKYVTNMYKWFNGCQCPTLDLSGFDTSRVLCMQSMFQGSKLSIVDLSSFDMSHIKDWASNSIGGVGEMFEGCWYITAIFVKKDANWFNETGFNSKSYSPTTDNSMFAFHDDCGNGFSNKRVVGIPNYLSYDYQNDDEKKALNLKYANTKDGYLTSVVLNYVKFDLNSSSVTIADEEGVPFDEWNRPWEHPCLPTNITIKFVPENGYELPASCSGKTALEAIGITGIVNGTWSVDANGVGTLSCKDITADFAINLTATAK